MLSEIRYDRDLTEYVVDEIASTLRLAEREDILRSYPTVATGIMTCWLASHYARVVWVGDSPVALFGLARDPDGVDVPWLLMTTTAMMEKPFRIVREARRKLAEIRKYSANKWANFVPAEDEPAISMIEALGFQVHRDVEIKRDGWPYYYFVMEGN